jgi:hypothetical protein
MGLPWFRFHAEFAGDPTIQSLAFEDQRHFVVLLCLKCDGVLDREFSNSQVRDRIICRALGLDPVSASEAKRRLLEVGLIDKNWQIPSWDRRQYKSDSSTQRVYKYRKTKESCNVSETFPNRSCNAPDTDTDTDTDKENNDPTDHSRIATAPRRKTCPYDEILSLWRSMMPELPQPLGVEHWTPSRKQQIRARWLDQLPDMESWEECFMKIRHSKFLMGRVQPQPGKKRFQCDLFWITKPENLLKLYEGRYHG